MALKYVPFTKKQLQLLTWWTDSSPYSTYNGVIAEGAVRSGKTLIMGLSFMIWSMQSFDKMNFALCGKTIGSLRRNVIVGLKDALYARGYKVLDRKGDEALVVSKNGRINTYYMFGGRDERSADLVQGITLAGVLFDEVALMPKSFVEQALARCSVENSKFWFNCNPEGPMHWFYIEHLLKAEELGYIIIHFNLDDNPSLSEKIKSRYRNMFKGIFYKRFILGEWSYAEGVIYDCFNKEQNTYIRTEGKDPLPIKIAENDIKAYYSSDYGTHNPMVYLEGYKYRLPGDPIPYFYIENEYYWDSKEKYQQKSDTEYVRDFNNFKGDTRYSVLIIDPSASSLIVALRQGGINVMNANNDVLPGIRMVYTLMSIGHIKINERNCPKLIGELGLYCWNDKKSKLGKEEPIKENDHACDALRYMIYTTTQEYEVYGDKRTK